MKISLLVALCLVAVLSEQVLAEGENDVKRGMFPFMGFIYYSDDTIRDASGARFIHGAVLIRPHWLISSAIELKDGLALLSKKTLLARFGAISIDEKFTLNEDEDEQEREVIKITYPQEHNVKQWWLTDITLMKTLLPFNMSSAVAISILPAKRAFIEKTCSILVYARKSNNSIEDKSLLRVFVDLLPPTVVNCGTNFQEGKMICAADSEENKTNAYASDFCHGNSGGPLICEGEVVGLQTYINNSCKQPHLYQLLSYWEMFITCGAEEKCGEEQCSNVCKVINKDAPHIEQQTETMSLSEVPMSSEIEELVDTVVTAAEIMISSSETTESRKHETTTLSPPTLTSAQSTQTTVELTTTTTSAFQANEIWPKQQIIDDRKKIDDLEEEEEKIQRKTNVEAQQQDVKISYKYVKNVSNRNVCLVKNVFVSFMILSSVC